MRKSQLIIVIAAVFGLSTMLIAQTRISSLLEESAMLAQPDRDVVDRIAASPVVEETASVDQH